MGVAVNGMHFTGMYALHVSHYVPRGRCTGISPAGAARPDRGVRDRASSSCCWRRCSTAAGVTDGGDETLRIHAPHLPILPESDGAPAQARVPPPPTFTRRRRSRRRVTSVSRSDQAGGERVDQAPDGPGHAPRLGQLDEPLRLARGAAAASCPAAAAATSRATRTTVGRDRQVVARRRSAWSAGPGRTPAAGSSSASTIAARLPYRATRRAAVFSPTPGTPGSPSLGSPRSAAKSA